MAVSDPDKSVNKTNTVFCIRFPLNYQYYKPVYKHFPKLITGNPSLSYSQSIDSIRLQWKLICFFQFRNPCVALKRKSPSISLISFRQTALVRLYEWVGKPSDIILRQKTTPCIDLLFFCLLWTSSAFYLTQAIHQRNIWLLFSSDFYSKLILFYAWGFQSIMMESLTSRWI